MMWFQQYAVVELGNVLKTALVIACSRSATQTTDDTLVSLLKHSNSSLWLSVVRRS